MTRQILNWTGSRWNRNTISSFRTALEINETRIQWRYFQDMFGAKFVKCAWPHIIDSHMHQCGVILNFFIGKAGVFWKQWQFKGVTVIADLYENGIFYVILWHKNWQNESSTEECDRSVWKTVLNTWAPGTWNLDMMCVTVLKFANWFKMKPDCTLICTKT